MLTTDKNTIHIAKNVKVLLVFLLGLTLLASVGCHGRSANYSEEEKQRAASLMPSDPELAALYNQTCKSCHAAALGGAPLTGSERVWRPRMTKGEDVLLNHTIDGYGGMPPLGACTDCGEEEFIALIRFMAGVEQ